ncbi:MAG: cytochrome c oxidase assembly protein [Chloroflexota bacterium]|nr:cytochrome c oxidase assembly protein [Chloroflexota bacterium]
MTTDTWQVLLSRWTFDPQIMIVVVGVGVLYWIGTTATLAALPKNHRLGPRAWKVALFYVALLLVVIALESPLDYFSQKLMWAHMIQHLILIMLVPELLLLGDPALPLLRGLPITARRRALGPVLGWRWVHILGAAMRRVSRPVPAFCLFVGTLWAWHWPALYNVTLRNQGVHDLEHLTFLLTAILFWWQVIDQTQFRCPMSDIHRAVYVFLGAVGNHLLAVVLAFVTIPLYDYRRLVVRPGGISALTDQQFAGGIMWVPGMFLYGAAFSIFLYKWLQSEKLAIGQSSVSAAGPRQKRLRPVVSRPLTPIAPLDRDVSSMNAGVGPARWHDVSTEGDAL